MFDIQTAVIELIGVEQVRKSKFSNPLASHDFPLKRSKTFERTLFRNLSIFLYTFEVLNLGHLVYTERSVTNDDST